MELLIILAYHHWGGDILAIWFSKFLESEKTELKLGFQQIQKRYSHSKFVKHQKVFLRNHIISEFAGKPFSAMDFHFPKLRKNILPKCSLPYYIGINIFVAKVLIKPR